MNKSIAIFDLDGCISDDRWRRHLLPKHEGAHNGDFDKYHDNLGRDRAANLDAVLAASNAGHEVVFITARPLKFKNATKVWLDGFLHKIDYTLLMRPDDNVMSSPELKVWLFDKYFNEGSWDRVAIAYDDRQDVLDAYHNKGVKATCLLKIVSVEEVQLPATVADVLRGMADTFEERNQVYGDNYKLVGEIMKILFPDGVPPSLLHSPAFHLFELKIVKLTRFAISGMTHEDSIHDDAVYSAMIQATIMEGK